MNNIGLVSIITPCYNASSTISQTIDSVLKQTYGNWEMLIIDDCSTDGSKEIIDEYARRDKRIRHYKTAKPSGSPAAPRNMGLENSSGLFVCFLDSDDLWLPDKLQKQLEYYSKTGHSFIFSNCEKVGSRGEQSNRYVKEPMVLTYEDLLRKCRIPSPSVMIAKSAIGETRFKNIQKEDYVFWMSILKKGYRAYNCGEVLTQYRVLADSRSSNKLEMVGQQWKVLRNEEGIGMVRSVYYMLHYIIYAFKKYLT